MKIGKLEFFDVCMLNVWGYDFKDTALDGKEREFRLELWDFDLRVGSQIMKLSMGNLADRAAVLCLLGKETATLHVDPEDELVLTLTDGTQVLAHPAEGVESWCIFHNLDGWQCSTPR